MEVDPDYKIDTRWPEYFGPRTNVSRLVQRPMRDIDGHALADAYMKDFRAKMRESRKEQS